MITLLQEVLEYIEMQHKLLEDLYFVNSTYRNKYENMHSKIASVIVQLLKFQVVKNTLPLPTPSISTDMETTTESSNFNLGQKETALIKTDQISKHLPTARSNNKSDFIQQRTLAKSIFIKAESIHKGRAINNSGEILDTPVAPLVTNETAHTHNDSPTDENEDNPDFNLKINDIETETLNNDVTAAVSEGILDLNFTENNFIVKTQMHKNLLSSNIEKPVEQLFNDSSETRIINCNDGKDKVQKSPITNDINSAFTIQKTLVDNNYKDSIQSYNASQTFLNQNIVAETDAASAIEVIDAKTSENTVDFEESDDDIPVKKKSKESDDDFEPYRDIDASSSDSALSDDNDLGAGFEYPISIKMIPYSCSKCHKQFRNKTKLDSHIRQRHTKPYKCSKCTRTFAYKRELSIHIKNHDRLGIPEGPFQCDICNKTLTKQCNLRRHILSYHTTEKPHKCIICNKRFGTNLSLRKHQKFHSEKPFQCEICGKKLRTEYSLINHQNVHITEKLFKCDICERKFKTEDLLFQHGRIHSEDNNFKCDICGKRYSRQDILNRHRLIHSREKPFQCKVCDKKFNQEGNLKQHERLHSKEKSFQCDICYKKFRQLAGLCGHRKSHRNKTKKGSLNNISKTN